MSIEQILGAALNPQQERDEPMAELNAEANAVQLKEAYARFREPHRFEAGDLVTWKPGLRNKKFPRGGQPAIVQEVLATPRKPIDDPSNTYSTEQLDLIIGVTDPDGDYLTFHADSRRFRPFKQGQACDTSEPQQPEEQEAPTNEH